MKKLVIASLVMLMGITTQAQTDNVTLNVRLNPIQTLVVNPQQKTVNLDYTTTDHYNDGVSAKQENHLNIFSTGGFEVKVKSSAAELANAGTAGPNGNIDASTIQIVATQGTQKALSNADYKSAVSLSTTEGVLVSSTKGARDKNIDIEYKAAGTDAYLDKYVANQTPTIFSTTVTYTIYAK
ncbi:hypothetical protein P3875_09730 [Myroides sp. JBRI-B21084]|uniref:hypothetical protein n=1 Tax=Myroides sp. JBRI-B21084 TaxID=3119977 RepID=UPI0026E1ECE7|nr:hypothetical protein [Paenimyroides cloacae]WKW46056.1 hypothetical protein P3875_09730 [Paenimyroides cloacae]